MCFIFYLFEFININKSLKLLLQERAIKQFDCARSLASFGFDNSPNEILIVLILYLPKLEFSLFNDPFEFTHIFRFERMSSLSDCIHNYSISPQVDLFSDILFLANQLRRHIVRSATNSITLTISICLIIIFVLRVLNP